MLDSLCYTKTALILSISLVMILISQSAERSSLGMDPETIPKRLNEQFQLHLHEPAIIINGPEISILNIEDSRCPSDVTCVWEGEVKISVHVVKDKNPLGNFTLTSRAGDRTMATQTVDGYSIQVIEVNPYPVSTKQISLSDYIVTLIVSEKTIPPPVKQFKSGIKAENIQCREGLQLIFKSKNGYPACVKPDTAKILIARGWAENQENIGIILTLSEGQREGPLLVQKIFPDSIQGLDFREYPLATNVGYPITLHIGDSASNGCTVELTLVKISNNTATFLKKEYQNRPCPICLSENTVIDTPNGPINVKELKDGMTVLTQDSSGHKQTAVILKTGRTLVPTDHKMVHVILDDKRELYVSLNHPTADGILFGELLVGDPLDGSKIKSAEQVPYNGTFTYDILPSGQTGFYWANGILVGSTLK